MFKASTTSRVARVGTRRHGEFGSGDGRQTRLSQRDLRHDELQPAAFHVALWLGAFGPAKPSAIAEAVGMDRSATSRLIRDLARLNLVDTWTDPADGRGVLACLSLEGRRRLDLAMAQKAAAFNERLWDWNDDDLAHLAALHRRLTAIPTMG
jgi:DNA-binding MarR family transcriptional regulator